MAASADIIAVLEEDRSADYLTIFPDAPGIFVWTGTINPSPDGVECVQHGLDPASDATIDYYLEQNGRPA